MEETLTAGQGHTANLSGHERFRQVSQQSFRALRRLGKIAVETRS